MAILLIDRTDIANYRQISDSVYDKVLNMHIQDAQFVDVQRLLGSDFYNDLIRNSTNPNYTALLDGGDYVYNGTTYSNYGLKAVIVHYFHSRYVMFGGVTDTPFSLVEKLNPDSQLASASDKKSLSKASKDIAFNYWENVKDFLDRNSDDYPLWKSSCAVSNQSGFKISKIGGSSRRPSSIASRFKYSND